MKTTLSEFDVCRDLGLRLGWRVVVCRGAVVFGSRDWCLPVRIYRLTFRFAVRLFRVWFVYRRFFSFRGVSLDYWLLLYSWRIIRGAGRW